MPSKSIHVTANSKISLFLWLSSIPLCVRVCVCVCVCITHLLYPFICWWVLRLLPYLGNYKNAAMNIGVSVSFWISVSVFFRYIPRSGIAGSHGNYIFRFFRNFHYVFHSGFTNIHFHQDCARVPFSPYPRQHLLFVFFLMIAILTGVKWYLMVVLICLFLMINNVEHLFMCLLAICISSLEKCQFSSSAHFLIRLFVFLMLSYWAVYVCWILTPYQSYHLQISSHIQ